MALTAAVAAVAAGQAVMVLAPVVRASAVRLPTSRPPATAPAAVSMGQDGHYWAQARINGQIVRMLVDTGATAVSLTAADALKVATASGEARAARITLGSVAVDGAEVRNVDALVLDRDTDASLLGMSYLSRLSGFDADRKTLRLHP